MGDEGFIELRVVLVGIYILHSYGISLGCL